MQVLATDLDRTLLPNGRWKADESAIALFNHLTEKHNITVVYVTGRNLALSEQAIRGYDIRYPHFLCGDVGSTIRKFENGHWLNDDFWEAHVRKTSPGWNVQGIRSAVAEVSGLHEQEAEHQNEFKQSYYLDHHHKDAILQRVDALIKDRFDEAIIYSVDSQNGKGLLDVLPKIATKQTALEHVANAIGVPREEVVFCGDSGNDILPLTAGFRGVLVRNADEQLVEQVKAAQQANPQLQAYFAQGNFRGLNGYYTSGVIEGAHHYGLFS